MVFVLGRALMDNLISPLELKIEEWKKVASLLDKDHAKGTVQWTVIMGCGCAWFGKKAHISQLWDHYSSALC